jgi:PAS domain S-box-containing protein
MIPRVLVVDDEADMASAIERLLKRHFAARVERAPNAATARRRLSSTTFDLVTLDYQLPDSDGLILLREIVREPGAPPVIIVTGHGGEDVASDALRFGASGYVQKDNRITTLLVEAVNKALLATRLEKMEAELARRESEYRHLVETANSVIIKADTEGRIVYINEFGLDFFGYTEKELLGKNTVGTIVPPVDAEGRDLADLIGRLAKDPETYRTNINENIRKNGERVWLSWSNHILTDDDGNVVGTLTVGNDITDVRKADRELAKYRAGLEELVRERTAELERANRRVAAINKVLRESPSCTSVQDVGGICISAAGELTGSDFGFVGFLTPEGKFTEYAISDVGWQECSRERPRRRELVTDMEIVSYWGRVLLDGEALLLNDPASHPQSRGVPDGDPPITAFLGVPLKRNGDAIGMIAQANKEGGYTPEDLEDLEQLGSVFVEALDRKQLELDLKEQRENMAAMVQAQTAELRESEQQMKDFLEELPVALYVVDSDGTMVLANRAMREMVDVTLDSSVELDELAAAADAYLAGTEEHYPMSEAPITWALAGEFAEAEDFELEVAGRRVPLRVLAAPIFDPSGRLKYAAAVSIDISKRKALEDELRRFKFLVDSLSEPVCMADLEGVVLYSNQAYEDLYGYSRQELIGRVAADLVIPPERRDDLKRDLKEAMDQRGIFTCEMDVMKKDGQRIPAYFGTSVIRRESGEPIARVTILRDLRETYRREEELRRLNEELEGYAHMVSHDLKSPLSAINLANAMLREEIAEVKTEHLRAEVEESVETIGRNLSRTYELINGLLSLAEAGHVPLAVESVDVSRIVEEILQEQAGPMASRKGEVRIEGDLGRITANRVHVYQVFANTITNAISHCDADRPLVTIRAVSPESDGMHSYQVCDNGSGIPVNVIEDVFRPFYSGSKGSHTGIGLSIAKKVVEVYGGRISVHNDGGACFDFTMLDWVEPLS